MPLKESWLMDSRYWDYTIGRMLKDIADIKCEAGFSKLDLIHERIPFIWL